MFLDVGFMVELAEEIYHEDSLTEEESQQIPGEVTGRAGNGVHLLDHEDEELSLRNT